jgi:hypothetical protein
LSGFALEWCRTLQLAIIVALFMFTQWVISLRRLKPAATGPSFVSLEESLNPGSTRSFCCFEETNGREFL